MILYLNIYINERRQPFIMWDYFKNIKSKKIKLLEENKQNSLWPWSGQKFLKSKTKAQNRKENFDKLNLSKLNTFTFYRVPTGKWKSKSQILGENIHCIHIWQLALSILTSQ